MRYDFAKGPKREMASTNAKKENMGKKSSMRRRRRKIKYEINSQWKYISFATGNNWIGFDRLTKFNKQLFFACSAIHWPCHVQVRSQCYFIVITIVFRWWLKPKTWFSPNKFIRQTNKQTHTHQHTQYIYIYMQLSIAFMMENEHWYEFSMCCFT